MQAQSLIQTIATVVGALSLAVATTAYLLSRKNLNFNVMIACIERFQRLLPALQSGETSKQDILKYIDLCDEEVFYFQHRYLRDEVALEWIDGMIEYLPIFNSGTKEPWERQQYLATADTLVHGFPRVMNAFTTSQRPNTATAASRREVAEEVLRRARTYKY